MAFGSKNRFQQSDEGCIGIRLLRNKRYKGLPLGALATWVRLGEDSINKVKFVNENRLERHEKALRE